MERKEIENLFNQYLEDGFSNIDIELYKGPVIGFDYNNMLYRFLGGELQISTAGLLIQIDYRNIKSIAI